MKASLLERVDAASSGAGRDARSRAAGRVAGGSMGDAANAGPTAVVLVVLMSLAFEGLVFGQDIAAASFPAPNVVDFGSCADANFWEGTGCFFKQLGAWFGNIGKFVFGTAMFIFNLVSFNVPGAPWFVRLILGGAVGVALLWPVAVLIRG